MSLDDLEQRRRDRQTRDLIITVWLLSVAVLLGVWYFL